MQVILWGRGVACACELSFDYSNNPKNILTLILHSFIRSLSNFRFFQIRPILPTILFWSQLQNVFRYVKLTLKYQIIKRGGFFYNPLYF